MPKTAFNTERTSMRALWNIRSRPLAPAHAGKVTYVTTAPSGNPQIVSSQITDSTSGSSSTAVVNAQIYVVSRGGSDLFQESFS